jgi:hypothetical protein
MAQSYRLRNAAKHSLKIQQGVKVLLNFTARSLPELVNEICLVVTR